MTTVRLLGFLFVVCFAGIAQAQPWSQPGVACIPDAASVVAGRYHANVASVQFAAGTTGQIVLNCQIERFDVGTTSWQLLMMYQDSTGTATTASVRATIYRMPIIGTTPVAVAGINSNNSATTGINDLLSPVFNHTFDFFNNLYWARVTLDRTATNQTVVFHSMTLASAAPSDIRLKHDIALLGRLDNGLGFYRFSYNGSDKAYVGVMAQEVEAIMPDAVVRGEDGYLRVFYEQLGLRMQTWEDWVAAGEKLPKNATPIQQ